MQSGAPDLILMVDTPMAPPAWALLERELLRAQTSACQAFFDRYFDDRGFLECVVRWGGNDGPDDAIENLTGWPVLHALGASNSVLDMYKLAWEGHLRQYTQAKTVDVPLARDGMYYREYPVTFDWVHHGETLNVFNLQGLSDPDDTQFQQRVRRYAGFYMNDDPQAPNYDPEHRIIKSLFNGSRGPLLRKATPLDWAGDPIEVEGRFLALHGEHNFEQMLAHFKDYTDIIGDHPQQLGPNDDLHDVLLEGGVGITRRSLLLRDSFRDSLLLTRHWCSRFPRGVSPRICVLPPPSPQGFVPGLRSSWLPPAGACVWTCSPATGARP